jgi:hypothetical protein
MVCDVALPLDMGDVCDTFLKLTTLYMLQIACSYMLPSIHEGFINVAYSVWGKMEPKRIVT